MIYVVAAWQEQALPGRVLSVCQQFWLFFFVSALLYYLLVDNVLKLTAPVDEEHRSKRRAGVEIDMQGVATTALLCFALESIFRHRRQLPPFWFILSYRELSAILFSNSYYGQVFAKRRRCAVDHLVYTCATLDEGIDAVERLTGVRAAIGGKHPGIGTHNALLSLGNDAYLEIIAPDRSQPPPSQPRPFHLDELDDLDNQARNHQIVAYAVHPFAAKGNAPPSANFLAITMHAAGYAPGPVARMSRSKPDGTLLRWRMTLLSKAGGPRPWIIDWGTSAAHPARTSPAGCRLVGLVCHGPGAEAMGTVLTARLGLQPLESGNAVEFVEAREGSAGYLVAELETPRGRVKLGVCEHVTT